MNKSLALLRNIVAKCSFLLLLSVLLFQFFGQGQVDAAVFARDARHGYFYNNNHGFIGSKLDDNGIEGINDVDSFVNYYRDQVFSSNAKKDTAGSFTVLLMLGYAPGTAKSVAESQFGEWEARVRAYSSAGRINFNRSYSYVENTRYNTTYNDVDWYPSSDTQNAIVFTHPNGTTFAIKKNCANPVGPANPLVSLTKNWNYNHNSFTTNPSSAELSPGTTVTITNKIKNDGDGTGKTYTHEIQRKVGSGSWTKINDWTGEGALGAGGTRTRSATYDLPNSSHGTEICFRGRITPYSGQSTPSSTTTSSGWRYSSTLCVKIDRPPVISCGPVTISPQQPEPGKNFTSTVNIDNSSGSETYSGGTATLVITPAPSSGNNQTRPVPSISGGDDKNVTSGNITADAGTYTLTWTISGGNASNVPVTCPSEVITVATKPYFRVYNGDISAGISAGCTVGGWSQDPDATIKAFNNGSGAGSGVQLAALALAAIEGFTSATGRSTAPIPPDGLSFANTLGDPYGGKFGTGSCPFDYFGRKAELNLDRDVTNDIIVSSPTSINNTQVWYTTKDVQIKHNITYGGAPWTINTIPSFTLIAEGDIYIDNNVTALDGVYIASGNIYTCSFGTSPPNATQLADDGLPASASCKIDRLTLNGAFIANNIKLQRSGGSIKDSANNEPQTDSSIAEVFIFNPAIWLSAPTIDTGSVSPYESITSLPPVL